MSDEKIQLGEKAMRLLLGSLGYPKHRHLGVVQQITGLSRTAASRKLAGLSPWGINEFAEHCRQLGSNIYDVLAAVEAESLMPATLITGDEKIPCAVRLGEPNTIGYMSQFVANQTPLGWCVHHRQKGLPEGRHAVEKLVLLSAPLPVHKNHTTTVAIVDGDQAYCDALCGALALEGFMTLAFQDLKTFLSTLPTTRYDAFVLDWMLPIGATEEALAAIRQNHRHEPVALHTAHAQELGVHLRLLTKCLTKYDANFFSKPTPVPVIAETLRRRRRPDKRSSVLG